MKRSAAPFKAMPKNRNDPRKPRRCNPCGEITARRADGKCRKCGGDPPTVAYQAPARPLIVDVPAGKSEEADGARPGRLPSTGSNQMGGSVVSTFPGARKNPPSV